MTRLHDGSEIDMTVHGDGPAIVIPTSLAPVDAARAEELEAWGADPEAGRKLVAGLVDAGYRVITADYEGHRMAHPAPATLTIDAVVADLLAIAGEQPEFAYYGYSWLAMSGLHLALRTDRLTGLAMGGFPPLDGPYGPMLAVTRAAHAAAGPQEKEVTVEPGDWDHAEISASSSQTAQFVTLYESLRGFDDEQVELGIPRLAFAGADDTIDYGPKWGDARVDLAGPLLRRRPDLESRGWTVEIVPGADHLHAMHASVVLPLLTRWLKDRR